MNKWLLVLAVLLALGAFLAIRFRRHIQMAFYLWRMFKKMRQMNKNEIQEKPPEKSIDSKDVPLVRCAKCGSWTEQTSALKFGKSTFYCSANCMEKSVEISG